MVPGFIELEIGKKFTVRRHYKAVKLDPTKKKVQKPSRWYHLYGLIFLQEPFNNSKTPRKHRKRLTQSAYQDNRKNILNWPLTEVHPQANFLHTKFVWSLTYGLVLQPGVGRKVLYGCGPINTFLIKVIVVTTRRRPLWLMHCEQVALQYLGDKGHFEWSESLFFWIQTSY